MRGFLINREQNYVLEATIELQLSSKNKNRARRIVQKQKVTDYGQMVGDKKRTILRENST